MKRLIIPALVLFILSFGTAYAGKGFWAQTTFLKGDVTYTRKGNSEAKPLTLGVVLHKGDTVTASENARASLLLNDGSVMVVHPGTETIPGDSKADGDPALATVAKNLSKTLLAREGDNPMLKHLGGLRSYGKNLALAPNQTKLKTGDVRFVWLDSPMVERYTFTLMGPDDTFYETTLKGTETTVPSDKLKPGTTYYWEVRDAALKNTITSLGSGSFTTLEEKTDEKIDMLIGNIEKVYSESKAAGDTTPYFLKYQIYREHGMNLNALMILEKMIRANPDNVELGRWKTELAGMMAVDVDDVSHITGE